MQDALKKADEVLQQGVQGITDLINLPALISLDFADVQTVMRDKGLAHIGIGVGHGDNAALEAAQMAIESPLLETDIKGASDIIFNMCGNIKMGDTDDATDFMREKLGDIEGEDVNIIFGAIPDDSMGDTITITVIATGLNIEDEYMDMPAGGRITSPTQPVTGQVRQQPVRPTASQQCAYGTSRVSGNTYASRNQQSTQTYQPRFYQRGEGVSAVSQTASSTQDMAKISPEPRKVQDQSGA